MDCSLFPKWYVFGKPVGGRCNLHCSYCYYPHLSHCGKRIDDRQWLETYIRQYIHLTPMGEEVVFLWHGGEPLLKSMDFYREAIRLQKAYANGHPISNVIQTNGTLLTEEWCRFLHDENWVTGISIDGPEHVHNRYRGSSFKQVMNGIELLNRYDADYTVMSVITDYSSQYPDEVYGFLRGLGSRYLQLEPQCDQGKAGIVSAESFGRFYNRVFDLWYRHDIGMVFVDLFEATLALMMGYPSPTCVYSARCGNSLVVEQDGEVYCCDHYVPRCRLGNMFETNLLALSQSGTVGVFAAGKMPESQKCRDCRFLHLCHGGCPRHRDAGGVNVLCEGYRAYYAHCLPFLQEIGTAIQLQE